MMKLHTKEILDYERSCRPMQSKRINTVDQIRVADHIHWCHFGSWRDGIVVKVQGATVGFTADLVLVRYSHVMGSGMKIQQEDRKIDLDSDRLYRFEYDDHCHPPDVVLIRAKACIEYGGYNALRNNNDDFCRWCKSGKHTYLCLNETFLCPFVDETWKEEDGVFRKITSTLDDLNEGDHISWLVESHKTKNSRQGWRHGIVIDIDQKEAKVITMADKSLTLEITNFTSSDFAGHLIHHYIYECCHMPEVVISRARSKIGMAIFPEEGKAFARFCKLGIPADSEPMKITITSTPCPKKQLDGTVDEKRKGTAKQVGAIVALSTSTATARVAEVATMRTIVGSVAKQTSRSLIRGAAEGAAAAAAVGVEAIILATEVTLTYKSFCRKEISKDVLIEQNIQNSVRNISAATGSIGAGAAGAAVGTVVFPGIGTIVGGIIGGIVGGVIGQISGHYAGGALASVARRPYEEIFVEDDVTDQM